jgi:hypothetical protein
MIFGFILTSTRIEHTFGWINYTKYISTEEFSSVSYYIFALNVMLMIGIKTGLKIVPKLNLEIKINSLKYILGVFYIWGAIFHLFNFHGKNYSDYVEYQGSDWGRVALNFGASLILIYIKEQKYLVACLLTSPFIYLAYQTGVRSYMLYSVIASIVYLILMEKNYLNKIFTSLFVVIISIILAAYFQINRSDSFVNSMLLPEIGLIHMMLTLYTQFINGGFQVQSNTMGLLANSLLLPYTKIFGAIETGIDNPIYIAEYLEGAELNDGFYHYPATWYGELFIGTYLDIIINCLMFGIIIGGLSKIVKNETLKILLMPSIAWIYYMIMRGAPVIAFTGSSYVLWLNIGLLTIFSILKKRR